MTIADNPEALASYVRHLGGEVLTGTRTFRFQIPLAETRKIIPEINKLNLQCVKVDEHTGTNPDNGHAISVATIEVRREAEKTDYEQERSLMATLIR
jgi:hypothetical protein